MDFFSQTDGKNDRRLTSQVDPVVRSKDSLLPAKNLSIKKRKLLQGAFGVFLIVLTLSVGLAEARLRSQGSSLIDLIGRQIDKQNGLKKITFVGEESAEIEAEQSEESGTVSSTATAGESITITKPSQEVKKQVEEIAPQRETKPASIQTTTSGNLTTTVVAEGSVSSEEVSRIAALPASASSPLGVNFRDETGRHAELENILKNYLNTLRWGSEISQLKEIVISDVADVDWSGHYNGTYTLNQSGDIVSAYGWINLNVNRYEKLSYFNDVMKQVIAHEYGHHYTQYYKWVAGDLPAGTRFPDSYYASRPLSKENTSTTCDNWSTCESEIIAEDYSYLYSGYGVHLLANQYGYPADPAIRSWLDNIASNIKSTTVIPTPPANAPPQISITSPVDGNEITANMLFAVSVSDDKAVDKVLFTSNSEPLLEDVTAPYEVSVDLSSYQAGEYTFKAKAFDSDGATAEVSFTLNIVRPASNQVNTPRSTPPQSEGTSSLPTAQLSVTFSQPASDPYTWNDGDLPIEIRATGPKEIDKIVLYINGVKADEEEGGVLARSWVYFEGKGTYTLKAIAYDIEGNTTQSTLTVKKK